MTKKIKKKTTKKAARKASPKPMVARRADLGANADGYFAAITGPLGAIATRLRQIVKEAAPKASEAIKWGMPVYEFKGMLCYIRARPSYMAPFTVIFLTLLWASGALGRTTLRTPLSKDASTLSSITSAGSVKERSNMP